MIACDVKITNPTKIIYTQQISLINTLKPLEYIFELLVGDYMLGFNVAPTQ